jgi:hypothetical protein
MRNYTILTGLFILLAFVILPSCKNNDQKIGNYSDDLSVNSKATITNEIMDLTTNWANAHNSMDPDKAIELWDSSPDLMFAENGEYFPNRDSIYSFLKSFYQSTTSMDVQWKQRIVVPLSLNSASMAGYFHASAKFKVGDPFEINSMFVGVFVRKNNKWVLIQGQESYK